MKNLEKRREVDIERAKGLAIILVVIGHVVARETPPGAEWFAAVKAAIYGFHMPFFMFLSGYVFYRSRLLEQAPLDYRAYFLGRVRRFLPAYLLFAVLVWIAKYVAQEFVVVDNRANGFADLLRIVVTPTLSVASFLWYLWVLMLFHLAAPLCNQVCRSIYVWFAVAAALLFVPGPYWFGMDKVCDFLFFFLLGGVVVANLATYQLLVGRWWLAAFVLFIVALVVLDPVRQMWLLGLLAVPALHGLVRHGPLAKAGTLAFVGASSYAIYLMNTLAIGGVKAVILRFTDWGGTQFYWVLPVLTVAGVLVPIVVKRVLFVRLPALDRITS